MRSLLFITIVLTFVQSHADESFSSYEDIVRQLSSPNTSSIRYNDESDAGLESVRIHASVGPTTSRLNLNLPGNLPDSATVGGVEAVFGIDLLSRRWIAEGAIRSYGREDFVDNEISLKEFDLRLVHQVPLVKAFDFRWGVGMSARYLSFSNQFADNPEVATDHTTPATLFLLGAQTKFNHAVGLTAEVAYRNRLISETVENSSIDGSLRISGTF